MALKTMLRLQNEMQRKNFGIDIRTLEGEDRTTFIKDMSLALLDEIHEALAEVGWKPWASSRHVNEEAFRGELIDAFHFMMNLFIAAGMEEEDIFEAYMAKRQKNIDRQERGYNGVDGKCPKCKRALDDTAVLCNEEECVVHPKLF